MLLINNTNWTMLDIINHRKPDINLNQEISNITNQKYYASNTR